MIAVWVVHLGKQTASSSTYGCELFSDEGEARAWAETQTGSLMSVCVQEKTVDSKTTQLTLDGTK